MSDELSSDSLARVRQFVDRWHSSITGASPSIAERVLIEEALVDYMLDEGTQLSSSASTTEAGLRALLVLAVDPGTVNAVATVRRSITELARRLDRQEHANLIMREHLVSMSERIRQLRTASIERAASCD